MRSTLPTLDGVQRSRLWPSRSAPHPAKTTNASVDNSLLRSRQAAIGHPWLPARAKDAFIDPFDLPSPNDRCLSVAVATDEVTDVFVRENVLSGCERADCACVPHAIGEVNVRDA